MHGDIESFLRNHGPLIGSQEKYNALVVASQHVPATPYDKYEGTRLAVEKAWEELKKSINMNNQHAVRHAVEGLAEKYQFLGGKWTIPCTSRNTNHRWKKLARETYNGSLGDCIVALLPAAAPTQRVLLMVKTRDYRDEADRERVQARLEALGFPFQPYMPDVFSACGLDGIDRRHTGPCKNTGCCGQVVRK